MIYLDLLNLGLDADKEACTYSPIATVADNSCEYASRLLMEVLVNLMLECMHMEVLYLN